jgi:aspartate/methionine/tyrosine aminotransferase
MKMNPPPALANRSLRISEAGAIQALARARELEAQGADIIHLEIGELDFDTPAHIVEAGVASLRDGRTRYAPTEGTPSLREAIADYVNRTRGTAVSPQHVIATPGVKGAIYFAIMGLIEAGDEVIVPDPGFPAYGAITRFVGGIPIPLPLRAENGFHPDLDELRSLLSPSAKMLVLNNPGNPTGAIFPMEILEAIAEMALEHNLWIVSDEIYAQLHFTESFPASIFAIPGMAERTILMDGFSKAYAMTGWRLGFGIFPEPMTGPVRSMMVNDHSCLPLFVQDAGEAALRGPQDCVAAFRDELHLRRDLVVDAFNQIPEIGCSNPEGAFYAMIDIRDLGGVTAAAFTDQLLKEGVSLLPGSILGQHGEGQVRLAYTVSMNQLEIALARIDSTVKRFYV